MKTIRVRFRKENKDIFDAIRIGSKKVETRAGTVRYQNIKAGDEILFVCGEDQFYKKVRKVKTFRSIGGLLIQYKPKEIHPEMKSADALGKLYKSFPGYTKKIKKFGLIAFELR